MGQENSERSVHRGRRIYDEAVRQALIVVWETSDRICGKRLKAASSMLELPVSQSLLHLRVGQVVSLLQQQHTLAIISGG